MQLKNPNADVFVPDGSTVAEALAKTTHMAVGAHQDDIEFMAMHGILECFRQADRWFSGITVTDGAGSPRSGPYQDYSDDEIRNIRVAEQRKAALVGDYACQIQLGFSSAAVKDAGNDEVVTYLRAILEGAAPDVVYLHNPADKHDTHVACCLRSIDALRSLPEDRRPTRIYGCEVWRGLDWLHDSDKKILRLDDRANIAQALCGVYDSQISGGKRYDLAVEGRHLANSSFFESHEVDTAERLAFAMDLTPLIENPSRDVADFALELLRDLKDDITDRIVRMSRRR
ncbi:MAG: PIG-L family deacetylase [Acidobacteria bacterium]|jgi:LmbE family N-acetylglucosaminyl deacetylase|nr:PIG-L family deacetylase [Acidobacteriota bacterium]